MKKQTLALACATLLATTTFQTNTAEPSFLETGSTSSILWNTVKIIAGTFSLLPPRPNGFTLNILRDIAGFTCIASGIRGLILDGRSTANNPDALIETTKRKINQALNPDTTQSKFARIKRRIRNAWEELVE